MEAECTDRFVKGENFCFEPVATCETAGCNLCVWAKGRDDEGGVVEKNICIQCHEGLFEHEGECVDYVPHPGTRFIWCPPEFDNCNLCRQEWMWNEEAEKYDDRVMCDHCANGKEMRRGECTENLMDGAFPCSDLTDMPHTDNCEMCRYENTAAVVRPAYCVSCKDDFWLADENCHVVPAGSMCMDPTMPF